MNNDKILDAKFAIKFISRFIWFEGDRQCSLDLFASINLLKFSNIIICSSYRMLYMVIVFIPET